MADDFYNGEVTEKQLWIEDIHRHLEDGDYVVYNETIYDYETGETICTVAEYEAE